MKITERQLDPRTTQDLNQVLAYIISNYSDSLSNEQGNSFEVETTLNQLQRIYENTENLLLDQWEKNSRTQLIQELQELVSRTEKF